MILQVDAGNTRLHWRVVERTAESGVVVRERGNVERGTVPEPTDPGAVTDVELACVAGDNVRDWLVANLAGNGGRSLREAVSERAACGVQNSYAEPGALGVDRWLAMVGAFNRYPGGVVVVDAGTAVTVDYVSPGGRHIGGYILPGVHLMSRALGTSTARVQRGSEAFGPPLPGNSTADCVSHGIGWIWSAAAERLRADREAHGLGTIVVTGGDRDFMTGMLEGGAAVEPDLVFMGMDRVFQDADSHSGMRG